MWALSSYFLYLYMVFIQHCFQLEQHCFHLDRHLSCSSNISNWLSRIPIQYSLVIQNSCSSWLSCTLSIYNNSHKIIGWDTNEIKNNVERIMLVIAYASSFGTRVRWRWYMVRNFLSPASSRGEDQSTQQHTTYTVI